MTQAIARLVECMISVDCTGGALMKINYNFTNQFENKHGITYPLFNIEVPFCLVLLTLSIDDVKGIQITKYLI